MIRFTERNIGNNPKLIIEAHSFEHVMRSPYMKLRWGKERDNIEFSEDGKVLFVTGSGRNGLIGYWKTI